MRNYYKQDFVKLERNYLIHPHSLALGLLLAGITALFLAFSGAYLYARIQNGTAPIKLPFLFVANSIILIASSYTIVKAMSDYKSDNTVMYKRHLTMTLILTVVFLVSQCVAWKQLYNSGVFVNHSNLTSYLYLISIVHFAHVIIGIPFLAFFLKDCIQRMKEPVSVLVYFSDEAKKRKLKLITTYWHYLDALWIYLVVFFLVNQLF